MKIGPVINYHTSGNISVSNKKKIRELCKNFSQKIIIIIIITIIIIKTTDGILFFLHLKQVLYFYLQRDNLMSRHLLLSTILHVLDVNPVTLAKKTSLINKDEGGFMK